MMEKLKQRFRGALDGLGAVAYALVTLAIIGGVGILITTQFNASTTNTNARAFFAQIADGYSTLGDFVPIVVIALIGLLLISFFRGRSE